jgi:hypothetical protein
MRYFHNQVQEVLADLIQTDEIPVFDNIAMGHDTIGAVPDRNIKENDIVLMVSLYASIQNLVDMNGVHTQVLKTWWIWMGQSSNRCHAWY